MVKFSLREDAAENYIRFFNSFLVEISRINDQLSSVLNMEMTAAKYDKLQSTISTILDEYKDAISGINNTAYNFWINSNASLAACVSLFEAGEDAIQTAKAIQTQMEDMMSYMLQINKVEYVVPDRPVITSEGFERIEDALNKAMVENEDLIESFLNTLGIKNDDENNIYGTLKPFVKRVSVDLRGFLSASLDKINELHEFVEQAAKEFKQDVADTIEEINIASVGNDFLVQASSDISASASKTGKIDPKDVNSTEKGKIKNKKLISEYEKKLEQMNSDNAKKAFDGFRELTKSIYSILNDQTASNRKRIPISVIAELADVYEDFYRQCGTVLKDNFTNDEDREYNINKECINVTKDRKNEEYFSEFGLMCFEQYASSDYSSFSYAAEAMKNIALLCPPKGGAKELNLLYAATVAFYPIIEGHVDLGCNEFIQFARSASQKIREIICAGSEDIVSRAETVSGTKDTASDNAATSDTDKSDQSISATDEEKSEPEKQDTTSEKDNDLMVRFLEVLFEYYGGEKVIEYLNKNSHTFQKNAEIMVSIKISYTDKTNDDSSEQQKSENDTDNFDNKTAAEQENKTHDKNNLYGRYLVTEKAKKDVKYCLYNKSLNNETGIHKILEGFDKQSAEMYSKREKGYANAQQLVQSVSDIFKFGESAIPKIKDFAEKYQNNLSVANIGQLAKLFAVTSLIQNPQVAAAAAGGYAALSFLKKILPKCQKSQLLSKLNSNFWHIMQNRSGVPPLVNMMYNYMFEHYLIENKLLDIDKSCFIFYHKTLSDNVSKYERRAFENCAFAAEGLINYYNNKTSQMSADKLYGMFLNTLRSGLVLYKDKMSDEKANELTDKLFNFYTDVMMIEPDLSVGIV